MPEALVGNIFTHIHDNPVPSLISDDFEGTPRLADGEAAELCWFDIDALPENLHHTDRKPIIDFVNYLKEALC